MRRGFVLFITRQSTTVSGVLNLNGQMGEISALGNARRTMAIVNAGAGLAAINVIRQGGCMGRDTLESMNTSQNELLDFR